MNKFTLVVAALGLSLASSGTAAVFKIAGFSFDEKNSVTTVSIVEGTRDLKDHSTTHFGRFSETYVKNPTSKVNEFAKFNRGNSIARLMGRNGNSKGKDYARFVSFPDAKETPPTPNVDRCTMELTWGSGTGLQNGSGKDFVVFEHASFQGFEVAVQKAGDAVPTSFIYQFQGPKDSIHEVNAVAYDLSDFGVAEGEMITAIRIRNIFNSKAPAGADKVDNESGQGNIVYPKDPGYDKAFTLREKAGGEEFTERGLSADIVYVTALRDVEPVKLAEPTPAPIAEPAPAAPKAPATTNAAAAKTK